MNAAIQTVGQVGTTGCSAFSFVDSVTVVVVVVVVVSELCCRCENSPTTAGPTLPCSRDKESTLRVLVRKGRVPDALKRRTGVRSAKIESLNVVPVITTQQCIRTTEGERAHRAYLLL